MKKLILGLLVVAATAAIMVPLSLAGPAPSPLHATGNVTWDYHHLFTGTTSYDASAKTGGTLDYTNSLGGFIHGGVVDASSVKRVGNTLTFSGTIPVGSSNYPAYTDPTYRNTVPGYFNAVVTDGGTSGIEGDEIAVFINEPAWDTFADVTGGNLGFFPTTKDECKNGGFERFGIFKNQGDCVSYVATGGANQPG